jgi:hypothetical protein
MRKPKDIAGIEFEVYDDGSGYCVHVGGCFFWPASWQSKKELNRIIKLRDFLTKVIKYIEYRQGKNNDKLSNKGTV